MQLLQYVLNSTDSQSTDLAERVNNLTPVSTSDMAKALRKIRKMGDFTFTELASEMERVSSFKKFSEYSAIMLTAKELREASKTKSDPIKKYDTSYIIDVLNQIQVRLESKGSALLANTWIEVDIVQKQVLKWLEDPRLNTTSTRSSSVLRDILGVSRHNISSMKCARYPVRAGKWKEFHTKMDAWLAEQEEIKA